MNIKWLHENGHLVKGAEATVVDTFGPDRSHPALQGVFAEEDEAMDTPPKEESGHPTNVVGIISAKCSPENGHVGAAPLARIRILELRKGYRSPDSEIVNFSAALHSDFWDRFQDEEYLRYSLKSIPPSAKKVLLRIAAMSDKALQRDALSNFKMETKRQINSYYSILSLNKLFIKSNGNEGGCLRSKSFSN